MVDISKRAFSEGPGGWSACNITVIASEAKQSIGRRRKYGLLRFARNDEKLKRADGKIAQPQIGVAAFFPESEQRPVQRLPQQIVALADGDADAFAEITALDKGPAREGAAFGRVGAVDPERQRDGIAEDEIDLAPP